MNDLTARPNSLPWPPIIYLAAIVVSVLLSVFYPLPWFGQPLSGILFGLGWLMIAAFVVLNISAIRAMRRAGTTVRPDRGTDHLVTDGPFSFTRNPLYLAGVMLVLGIGLVSGIVWFFLLAILAAFTVQKLAIEREERHLQARFGETYLNYAGRVRRWIQLAHVDGGVLEGLARIAEIESKIDSGRKGTVVVFIGNHCPYVKAVIDRMVSDARALSQEVGRAGTRKRSE